MTQFDAPIINRAHLRALSQLLSLSLSLSFVACGRPGDKPAEACGICGALADIRGSIAGRSGSQAIMNGWVVASFEQDTAIARVTEVDNAGLFTLKQLKTSANQTLALFTPDYTYQAALAIPSKTEKYLHQYFTVQKPVLPLLINKGPMITFQNLDGLKIAKEVTEDKNGDGIPEGVPNVNATGLSLTSTTPDLDRDTIPNNIDTDIDGDGVPNVIDPDDDGDGIYDVFDGDQNSDLVNDTSPGGANTDLYFKEGVEWIAVQYELRPSDDVVGQNETTVKFMTKVRDIVNPTAVQIRGAPSLLRSATYKAKDASGTLSVQPWNMLLADDGLSEDSAAGDRFFARRITLASGKSPRAYETVFFQLAFGPTNNPWFMEFAYIFPPVKPSMITGRCDMGVAPLPIKILLSGSPFGDSIRDYLWTVTLWDQDGKNAVWTSPAQAGSKSPLEYDLPRDLVPADVTYKFSITAQSLDKIPGYPAYVVQSAKTELSATGCKPK